MATITVKSKANVANLTVNQIANGNSQNILELRCPGLNTISLQLVGTTTSGNISATFQPQVSNDGATWTNFGGTVALAAVVSGSSSVLVVGSHSFKYFRAVLSALTGTGAAVTLTASV
jgi:hypothetical protein